MKRSRKKKDLTDPEWKELQEGNKTGTRARRSTNDEPCMQTNKRGRANMAAEARRRVDWLNKKATRVRWSNHLDVPERQRLD